MAFIEDTLQGPRRTGTWLDEQDVVEKRKVKDKVVVKPTVAELMPIVDITENDAFEMRDGTYLDIVQLTSKDIYSLNEEEKDHDVFSLAYLLQAYTYPLKVVPLNTPLSLERQKISIERQIRQNQTLSYLPFLLKKKQELEYLEEHRTNRDYLLFFYADDERTLRERKTHLYKLLRRSNPMRELTLDQKVHVLYQLNNPNTKPQLDA